MEYMTIDSIGLHQSNANIAQGALTNSKHWDRFVKGVYPTHVISGSGSVLHTRDNKRYIDFICGLGCNLFGYGNEKIRQHVLQFSFHGESHSLPSTHELDASERVKEMWPFIEKVKFLNDGSSACTAATIIARAYALKKWGKLKTQIYSAGYHGWHPEFVSLTPPGNGVCDHRHIRKLPYHYENEIIPEATAAIIIEPVELDDSRARIEWLKRLRTFCDAFKIVLIFDEVITGMRYPKYSVSSFYEIYPDLILLSKAIANGDKIAVVGGKSEIMDNEYFISGTFHGHTPSLIALERTIAMAMHDGGYDMEYLKEESIEFVTKLNEITRPNFWIDGWGSRGAFKGDKKAIAIFWQEMVKAGFLFGPSLFTNFDLIPHFADVLTLAQNIKNVGYAKIKLEGNMPSSPFSAKQRT